MKAPVRVAAASDPAVSVAGIGRGSAASAEASAPAERRLLVSLGVAAALALTILLWLGTSRSSAAVPREPSPPIAGLTTPSGVSIDQAGHPWVTDTGDGGLVAEYAPFPSTTRIGEQDGQGKFSFGGEYVESAALDGSNEHLYVGDSGNVVVHVFDQTGAFETTWSGLGGSFLHLAVDDSGAPSAGRVYVSGTGGFVRAFTPDHEPADFSATAPYIVGNELTGTPTGPGGTTVPFPRAWRLTVGPTGDIYVVDQFEKAVYEFEPSGTFVRAFTEADGSPFGSVQAAAVDPTTGNVLVAEQHAVIELGPTGAFEQVITEANGSPFGSIQALAVDAEGDLYVTDSSEHVVDIFGPAALLPKVTYKSVSAIAETSATVNAEADPNGGGEIEACSFEYGTSTAYDASAPCSPPPPFAAATEVSAALSLLSPGTTYHYRLVLGNAAGSRKGIDQTLHTPGPPSIGASSVSGIGAGAATIESHVNPSGFDTTYKVEYGTTVGYGSQTAPVDVGSSSEDQPTTNPLTGLQGSTTYHFRIVAQNHCNTAQPAELCVTDGPDQEFTTLPGLLIHSTSASDISATSADLQAEIDPLGTSTEYHFEYGTTVAYGNSVPVPDASVGSGVGEVEVSQRLQNLSPGTTYHYRVVARNVFGIVDGTDHAFTAQIAGSFTLPDGRQWELVSPVDKGGGVLEPISQGGPVQAAASGDALTYLANAPTEAALQGNAGLVQVLSTRGASGWDSKDIANPHERATGLVVSTSPEYRLFTEDLSSALIQPYGLFEAQLSPQASEQTPYIRVLGSCASGCYRPLVTGKPGFANVPPGTRFGEERTCEENPTASTTLTICGPLFLGASSDLNHVVLYSAAPLIGGAPREALYEWSAGSLQLVSVLPKNEAGVEIPAPEGSARLGQGLTSLEGSAKRAVSADGARIFWEAQSRLFLRDTVRHQTLELDTAEAACLAEPASRCESGGGKFQIASTNGESVLFTDTNRLTAGSGAGDLYECMIVVELSGKLACDLTDLTPESAGESAAVMGNVLGAGNDDQSVYFVANGVLTTAPNPRGQRPSPGGANLYARSGEQTNFIATLALSGDFRNWSREALHQPTRVSPNGRWLAFMSERSLTGYDNRDAVSGKPDAEVYQYDASTNSLTCASCNPSGARPVGAEFARIFDSNNERLASNKGDWPETGWVASLVPPSTYFNTDIANNSAFVPGYQSRALSNSGRLFFNSLDALSHSDVNSNFDVYQHEPAGVGGCGPAAQDFDPTTDSCLGLISSGTNGRESAFLDASETGADVFFLTSARLVPQDVDNARDVYDAHECAAGPGCFPTPPPTPPACEGDACQAPATPPVDATPGSLTFNGAGNALECPKGRKLQKGKCVKQKAKKHKKKRHTKSKKKVKKRANSDRRGHK